MNTSLKKFVAAAVCAGMVFSSGIYAVPACAARHSPAAMRVSTVKKGNAYIPEGIVLQVELTKELSSKTAHVGDAVPLRLVENLRTGVHKRLSKV